MTKWRYTDATNTVAFRELPDGRMESQLAASLPGVEILSYVEPPEPIPTTVTMRQARLALLGAGLLASVDAAIDGLPSPQKEAARIEWEYATEVQRSSGTMSMMGAALGLDDAGLDALFIAAVAL